MSSSISRFSFIIFLRLVLSRYFPENVLKVKLCGLGKKQDKREVSKFLSNIIVTVLKVIHNKKYVRPRKSICFFNENGKTKNRPDVNRQTIAR